MLPSGPTSRSMVSTSPVVAGNRVDRTLVGSGGVVGSLDGELASSPSGIETVTGPLGLAFSRSPYAWISPDPSVVKTNPPLTTGQPCIGLASPRFHLVAPSDARKATIPPGSSFAA